MRAAASARANSGRSERLPLHFRKFTSDAPIATVQIIGDGRALRLDPQAALTLLAGADPVPPRWPGPLSRRCGNFATGQLCFRAAVFRHRNFTRDATLD